MAADGIALGTIAWDGTPHFWLPGATALFDPEADTLTVQGRLPADVAPLEPPPDPVTPVRAAPRWDRDDYCAAVTEACRRMRDGELEKVILSVPFTAPCPLPPLQVYRRLTADAPSGLRFLIEEDGTALVGASPEPLVLLEGRRAHLHLLAGTRPAGRELEQDLLSAPKDRAEHSVAVEQSRRDLLSVCTPGSVAVPSFMQIERHPGLIHLASHLVGELRPDAGRADLIRACFPAGTVGGVPREAAAALIAALEPHPRGWYAGAVGAILPGGDLQLWLTIRTLSVRDGVAVVRTGAGLVAGSDPQSEWQECCNKARRTLAALGAEVAAGDL
jgi:anthranilate synthase component 1